MRKIFASDRLTALAQNGVEHGLDAARTGADVVHGVDGCIFGAQLEILL